jgi:hypothetical protein
LLARATAEACGFFRNAALIFASSNSVIGTRLLESIDTSTLVGLRDRALIGVMTYAFARIGAVVGMRVEDYYPAGKRWWVRLHEKGGKRHEMPTHHKLEAFIDEYLAAAGIREDGKTPLFRSAMKTDVLTDKPMNRVDAYRMVRRRTADAGFKIKLGCHVFRATGITAYLEAGGTLENAEQHRIGELADIEPLHVAAYIEGLQATARQADSKAAPGRHPHAVRLAQLWLVDEHKLIAALCLRAEDDVGLSAPLTRSAAWCRSIQPQSLRD